MMTQAQVAKVVELVKSGHSVKIIGPYLDDFAIVHRDETNTWFIHSQVWSEKPLTDQDFNKLSFFKRIEVEA